MIPQAAQERFVAKYERRGPDECWPWRAGVSHSGYGRFVLDGRIRIASQVAWEIAHGTVFPAGKLACHHCDNPSCVNPSHIYAGSPKDNVRDMIARGRGHNSSKTHCSRGHDLNDPANIRIRRLPHRVCRKCQYVLSRKWLLRRRAEAHAHA